MPGHDTGDLVQQLQHQPPCPHRYVRPEVKLTVPMFTGEATQELLGKCTDCGKAIGVRVTVQLSIVEL